jgi:NAD(P)-dependent dehydrogenase (short-subunit alcohol dehydrogenase family)
MRELGERVAVVTGGGSGIGEGIAHACAAAGMRVVIGDVEQAAAARVADDLLASGAEALALGCDVSKRAGLDALADATWSRFGGCHLLCNNAGVLVQGALQDMREEDWSWVLDVNLRGVVNGVHAFVPRMLAQGGPGHIVNTASMCGLVVLPNLGVYTTSKFAVVGLTEALRQDLAPHGIGVSVLCPAGVATRIGEAERNRPGGARHTEDLTTGIREQVHEEPDQPQEVVLEPREVGEMVLDAVREDELYVVTHSSWRPLVERHYQQLLGAFDRAAQRGR